MTIHRYEGHLRGCKSVPRGPVRLIVCAVRCAAGGGSSGAGLRAARLADWCLAPIDRTDGGWQLRPCVTGAGQAECWLQLAAMIGPRHGTYVVSPRALQAWQVLGLWDRIEGGSITLSGRSGRPAQSVRGQGTGRPAPLLLTADPPTAAALSLCDGAPTTMWTCAGNYGLQPLASGADAVAECLALGRAIVECLSYMEKFGLSAWGITAGSMALSGWLSSYTGAPLYLSSGRRGDDLERRSLYGGILYARPTGESPILAWSVDCRSMYPHISTYYPQAVDMAQRGLTGAAADRAVRGCPTAALAEVTVRTDRPCYPCRVEGETRYPVGEYRTVLPGPELADALRHGRVLAIHRAHVYRLGCPLAEYQQRVWRARVECAGEQWPLAAAVIKRLGVSLIGKLCQSVEEWTEVAPDINDPLWGSWTHVSRDGRSVEMRARAGVVEESSGRTLAAHALPALSSWIWSYGRIKMRHWMDLAGADAVWYADTDGMIVTHAGLERLRSAGLLGEDRWGALRVVSGPHECVIGGPKDYQLGPRRVKAGERRQPAGTAATPAQGNWFRLPWDQLHCPEWSGTWVERLR